MGRFSALLSLMLACKPAAEVTAPPRFGDCRATSYVDGKPIRLLCFWNERYWRCYDNDCYIEDRPVTPTAESPP